MLITTNLIYYGNLPCETTILQLVKNVIFYIQWEFKVTKAPSETPVFVINSINIMWHLHFISNSLPYDLIQLWRWSFLIWFWCWKVEHTKSNHMQKQKGGKKRRKKIIMKTCLHSYSIHTLYLEVNANWIDSKCKWATRRFIWKIT